VVLQFLGRGVVGDRHGGVLAESEEEGAVVHCATENLNLIGVIGSDCARVVALRTQRVLAIVSFEVSGGESIWA
jgi:hypothetical protein